MRLTRIPSSFGPLQIAAFWLARIEETDERKAQTEIFATTLATRVGKPVELGFAIMEAHVMRAQELRKSVVR